MLDKNLIPETIPFDFDDNYAAVKQKFADYGYDTQEGSNTMQLAIAMSYLTSMLNANTAVNINEMLLPIARKRRNALQGARLLGYEIRHTLSYKYKLTLEFPEGMHRVNRYEKFTSNGKNYYYMGDNIPAFEGPKTLDLVVSEGNLKQWKDDESLVSNLTLSSTSGGKAEADYYVDVPYTRVAEDGLRVFVSYVEPTGVERDLEEYPRMDNFVIDADMMGKRGFVRLDNIDFGTPRIYFKLGDVGIILPENTKVRVDVLISSGGDGVGDVSDFESDLECEITKAILVSNGSEEESLESIRRNAPLFHNSANRLVTKNDYLGYFNRDSRIKNSTVWDGGDEYPYRPGNVWFSTIPNHTKRIFINNTLKTKWELQERHPDNWYISDGDVENIKDSTLDIKVPTLTLHHRHPVYLNFDYKIQVVRYSRSLTTEEWNEKLFDTFNDYFIDTEIKPGAESYVFEYFQSSLDKRLDVVLTDVTGFNISLENSVTISSKDIINEVLNSCDLQSISSQIRFHLGTPFESFYSTDSNGISTVETEYLPRLHTIIESEELSVDFDSPVNIQNRVIQYPIMLGSDTVGIYRVFLDVSDTIEVIIFASPDTTEWNTPEGFKEFELKGKMYYITSTTDARDRIVQDTSTVFKEFTVKGETFYVSNDSNFISYIGLEDDYTYIDREFLDGLEIKVMYKSPNFKITRNTLPSLRSVEFINR